MILYGVSAKVKAKLHAKTPVVNLWEVDEALSDPDVLVNTVSRNRKRREVIRRYVGFTEGSRLLVVFLIFKPDGVWLESAYSAPDHLKKRYNQR